MFMANSNGSAAQDIVLNQMRGGGTRLPKQHKARELAFVFAWLCIEFFWRVELNQRAPKL